MTLLRPRRAATGACRGPVLALAVLLLLAPAACCAASWAPSIDPAHINTIGLTTTGNTTPLAFSLPYEAAWQQHPHLVAAGILASDGPERRAIRAEQRQSWMTYPQVARRENNFTGQMLVLYASSVKWKQPPFVTPEMVDEMVQHEDVLLLTVYDEPPTQKRLPGQGGSYGEAFHVSNTRKVLLLLRYLYLAFPDTPFYVKADDDAFIYVPEYMRVVRQLPRVSTVYGMMLYRGRPRVLYGDGPAYLMTRDLAFEIFSEWTVTVLTSNPYRSTLGSVYEYWQFFHEDMAMGLTLRRRYYDHGEVRQAPAALAYDTPAGMPRVEGVGEALMRYMEQPTTERQRGVAVTADGRYNMSYRFPDPATFKPRHIFFVDDRCRMGDQRYPEVGRRFTLSHKPVKRAHFQAHLEYNRETGEDQHWVRPEHWEVFHTGAIFYYIRFTSCEVTALTARLAPQ